jgi:nucleoside-diphosphate-sugar epimerase
VRILVLGGTRFVGPFLVRELAAAGHQMMVFHRGEREPELPAQHVHGDFARFDRDLGALREFEPEVVIDMLAVRASDAARVGAFAGSASHAVVLSSADVYRAFGRIWRSEPGPPDPVPLTEDSPLREQVLDAEYDKIGVEAALRKLDLPVTVLRLTGIHGPGDFQHRLWSYLKRMDDGRPAILLDQTMAYWRWARVYVEDAAHATALAAINETAAGTTFNVAVETAATEAEWISEIGNSVDWKGQIVTAPSELLPDYLRENRFDLRQDYVVDSTLIRQKLGYQEIVGAAEAMQRTIAWERANAPCPTHPHPDFVDRFDYEAEDDALTRIKGGTTRIP